MIIAVIYTTYAAVQLICFRALISQLLKLSTKHHPSSVVQCLICVYISCTLVTNGGTLHPESSPALTILVPLWFIIISLVFFYLIRLLFWGFRQFKCNSLRGQNNYKIPYWTPSRCRTLAEVGRTAFYHELLDLV